MNILPIFEANNFYCLDMRQ